jgi:hypothetical protein
VFIVEEAVAFVGFAGQLNVRANPVAFPPPLASKQGAAILQ